MLAISFWSLILIKNRWDLFCLSSCLSFQLFIKIIAFLLNIYAYKNYQSRLNFRGKLYLLIINNSLSMAELYHIMKPQNKYFDRKNYQTQQAYNDALAVSSTVYIGNLSFYTTQDSIRELFSLAGNITQIKMGIDNDGNPCGFAFVKYETREEALLSVEFISRTKLNNRIIRVDLDPGYKEGRQKGRGTHGQQKRDDFRRNQDAERPKKQKPKPYNPQYGQRSYKRDFNDRRRQPNTERGGRQFYKERRQYNNNDRRQYNNDRQRQPRQSQNRRGNYNSQRSYNNDRSKKEREDNEQNLNRAETGKYRQAPQDVEY